MREKKRVNCVLSPLDKCHKQNPLSIAPSELKTIKSFVQDQQYKDYPLASICYIMKRQEKAFISLTSFYKYAKYFDNVPNRKLLKAKQKTGIRAAKPKEIIHADVCIYKPLDHTKVFIYFIVDNFPRMILGWRVSTEYKSSVMLDEISGFQMASILKKNKTTANIPIIFCTAKDTEDDTLKGLDLGADDYISKPFSVKEVVARVKTVLRRSTQDTDKTSQKTVLQYENLIVDAASKKINIEGKDVLLTKKEFEILYLLLQNPNKVFSRESLLENVWSDDVYVIDRTIDVHINRLRKKIVPYDRNIIARLGYGYCFET